MRLALYIILLLAVINAVVLDKALGILSLTELKRRARAGRDKKAAAVYRMAAYGRSLSVLLWLKGTVAAALFIVLVIHNSWVWALVFLAALAWAVRIWRPASTKNWVWSWAAMVSPVVAWAMNYMQPILGRLGRSPLPSVQAHTGLYEREDLLELLKAQVAQPENRIPEPELRMAFNALTFGGRKVGDVMTPLRELHLVSEDEPAGPVLMDELHKTGQSRFAVAKAGTLKSAQPQIVGSLLLTDLIGYDGSGSVGSLMQKKVFYVNETQDLRSALAAFLKTHHHLLIVVNNFEEVVGALSIEDVLEQIVGAKLADEFDKYDDLKAVAGWEAEQDQPAGHGHPQPQEPPEQTPETVVN